MSTEVLSEELKFYAQNLPNWLDKHTGRVVLVKGDELVGFFDDEAQAMSEGARLFGLSSFLVRRIEPTETAISVPALTLGILRGDNPRPILVQDSGA
ncbi:MAG: hypothetical protein HYX69_00250 [Planctomycetia bacterium]|nr:hypothetical protein [Planctomycetia bacterium]